MASTKPLEVIENNDPVVQLALTQAGAALSLTGCVLSLKVKASAETADASAMFSYSSSGAGARIIITDAAAGLAKINFNKTDLVTPGDYWYRIDVTLADARVETVCMGRFTIRNA